MAKSCVIPRRNENSQYDMTPFPQTPQGRRHKKGRRQEERSGLTWENNVTLQTIKNIMIKLFLRSSNHIQWSANINGIQFSSQEKVTERELNIFFILETIKHPSNWIFFRSFSSFSQPDYKAQLTFDWDVQNTNIFQFKKACPCEDFSPLKHYPSIFNSHFIQIRVITGPESILGTLGIRWEYILDRHAPYLK